PGRPSRNSTACSPPTRSPSSTSATPVSASSGRFRARCRSRWRSCGPVWTRFPPASRSWCTVPVDGVRAWRLRCCGPRASRTSRICSAATTRGPNLTSLPDHSGPEKGTETMTTKNLTMADFESTIVGNDIVLVDFWASWCGPCRAFAPVFDKSSQVHPEIVHAKVDTEAEQQLAAMANIRSIPTIMAFREGVLVYSQPGALPAPALEDLITRIEA